MNHGVPQDSYDLPKTRKGGSLAKKWAQHRGRATSGRPVHALPLLPRRRLGRSVPRRVPVLATLLASSAHGYGGGYCSGALYGALRRCWSTAVVLLNPLTLLRPMPRKITRYPQHTSPQAILPGLSNARDVPRTLSYMTSPSSNARDVPRTFPGALFCRFDFDRDAPWGARVTATWVSRHFVRQTISNTVFWHVINLRAPSPTQTRP